MHSETQKMINIKLPFQVYGVNSSISFWGKKFLVQLLQFFYKFGIISKVIKTLKNMYTVNVYISFIDFQTYIPKK